MRVFAEQYIPPVAAVLAIVLATSAGCARADFELEDEADVVTREHRGGRFHRAALSPAVGNVDLPVVLAAARADLATPLAGLSAGDFVEAARWSHPHRGAGLTYLSARQQVDGIPIRGTFLQLAVRVDAGERRLVGSSYRVFSEPRPDLVPLVPRDEAVRRARAAMREGAPGPAEVALELEPRQGRLQLVWSVRLPDRDERATVVANGAEAGRVEVIDERVYERSAGVVRGWVADGGAPREGGPSALVELADLEVRSGAATVLSDAGGGFTIEGAGGIEARLSGLAAIVVDGAAGVPNTRAEAGDEVELVLGAPGDEGALAQVTAYRVATEARRFLLALGAPEDVLGAPLHTRVNLAEVCNAYYSPAQRSINFYRSGGGCHNSAEASIVAHEYGHFIDDRFGGIVDGGLSEGWGDVLACLLLDSPEVGADLVPGGGPLRSCDNDYRYPAGGADGVHALGQAWSGFVWHLREELVALYGAEEGRARTLALVMPSLMSGAPDIPAAVREVVIRDDDDGDPATPTPHWDHLRAAAARHGLAFVLEDDLVPPAAPVEVRAQAVGPTRIDLSWIAPGDDGHDGSAAHYELRYSPGPITPGNLAEAEVLPAPAPLPAGSEQRTSVAVPPLAETYLALRAIDDAGNASEPVFVGPIALPAPVVMFSAGAEDGLDGWTASGLWHVTDRAASAGAASFWYGNPTTGTYDTGARNLGTLRSPVVDLRLATAPQLVFDELLEIEPSPSFDVISFEAVDVDTGDRIFLRGKPGATTGGRFVTRLVDATALAGRRVRLELFVDTVDADNNALLGWMVDEVRILAEGTPRGALLVNEILADPPPGFDANGDGVASSRDDEFIELVNVGDEPLDLGGARIEDAVTTRVVLPEGTTLAPGRALVVFGGGTSELAGAVVAQAGLYLNNDGDVVRVRDRTGEVLAELEYGPEGGKDVALVRAVDGDPWAPMVPHTSVVAAPASPGTRSDGAEF